MKILIVAASRCSRCGGELLEGEIVGLEGAPGRQRVLCCLCSDPQASKLAMVRRRKTVESSSSSNNGIIVVHEPPPDHPGH